MKKQSCWHINEPLKYAVLLFTVHILQSKCVEIVIFSKIFNLFDNQRIFY